MFNSLLMRLLFAVMTLMSGTLWADSGLRAEAAIPAPVQTERRPSAPVILIVGDSLSAGYGIDTKQGWVALLERRLKSEGYGYRVVNASVSGETSAGARLRLPRLFELHRPAMMILEIGANDGLRGYSLDQIRENLSFMLDLATSKKAQTLLIGMHIPPNYGAKYAEGFYNLFAGQAKSRRLRWVPFFLDGVALDMSLMQADGFHPTAAAQPRLLDNAWKELRPMLSKSAAKK